MRLGANGCTKPMSDSSPESCTTGHTCGPRRRCRTRPRSGRCSYGCCRRQWGEDALQRGWVSLLARWLPAAPQRVPVVGLLRVDPIVPVARGKGAQLPAAHRPRKASDEEKSYSATTDGDCCIDAGRARCITEREYGKSVKCPTRWHGFRVLTQLLSLLPATVSFLDTSQNRHCP